MVQPTSLPIANNASPLRTHAGQPFDASRWQRFAPPPPEIGEVISVSSDVKVGAGAPSIVSRLGFAIVLGIVGTVVGFLAGLLVSYAIMSVAHLATETGQYVVYAVAALGAALGMFIGFAAGGIGGGLDYVGRDGIATFHFRGRPDDLKPIRLLRFADVDVLIARITDLLVNGKYSQTKYVFEWCKRGQWTPVSTVNGSHRTQGASPPPEDRFHFALAAERAWTQHLLARAAEQLKQQGYVEFKMSHDAKDQLIRVGPGFLEFVRGAEVDRCQTADVAEITVIAGEFTVRRRDAKVGWFSSSGVYRFKYGEMENAKCFLLVLSELAGFSFAAPRAA